MSLCDGRILPGIVLCLLVVSADAEFVVEGDPSEPWDHAAGRALCEGLSEFTCDLYGQMAKRAPSNMVFSPLSIAIAVSSTYAGARGDTERQITKVLHTDLGQDDHHAAFRALWYELATAGNRSRIQFNLAMAFMMQEDLKFDPAFLDLLKNTYNYELHQGDFAGADTEALRQRLNVWVARNTNNRITDMIPRGALGKGTRFVNLNAVYFKGRWSDPFAEQMTRKEGFQVAADTRVKVPTMRKVDSCSYGETNNLQLVEMTYEGAGIGMVIILPTAPTTLGNLETTLSRGHLESWLKLLEPPGRYDVELHLPKFRIDDGADLEVVLSDLGMTDVYDVEKADLTGMAVTCPPLIIDASLHRAGIIVNEEGTEAWGATADFGALGGLPAPRPRRLFRADHPFLFLIRERRTGVILFMGRVVDPR